MATTASLPVYMIPGVPIRQPAHLEGDASLATEILPGPPSLLSAQQSAQKRDPRKPSTAYSYLPSSDPGSTYSGIMHGTFIGQEIDGPRTKRSRPDKGASSRAQRASARSQLLNPGSMINGEAIMVHTTATTAEHEQNTPIEDELSISRTNSSHNLLEGTSGTSANGRVRRKDKGKAKEFDPPIVRVKEEPKVISLHSPEPPITTVNSNEDHCSSCRSQGILVYCDSCPKAFHLACLDPPLDKIDDGDSRWYCPACTMRKHPPRKPPPSLLSPLIYQVETSIPSEFQLPDDIRNFYKDVATGPKGTYVDASELKPPRLNRLGQLEDRDVYRLRDRNGMPILCFRCGTSALPDGLAAAAPAAKRVRRSTSRTTSSEGWKSMISCDYCNLHWHIDCLEPPLTSIPSFTKKWMCPNHSEQVLPSKRRIPKQNTAPIEITKLNQFNNGSIEIIYPQPPPDSPNVQKTPVDEVLINGRRYRVPERIILLDFWSKLRKNELPRDREGDASSRVSSPLTSLSSLEDLDDRISSDTNSQQSNSDEFKVAQMLLGLRHHKRTFPSLSASIVMHTRQMVDSSVQTDQPMPNPGRPGRQPRGAPKRLPLQVPSNLINNSRAKALSTTEPGLSTSSLKRRKSTQTQPTEPSTRELRSKNRNTATVNDGVLSSVSSKVPHRGGDEPGKRSVHVKLEEPDFENNLKDNLTSDAESIPLASVVRTSRRGRPPRRPVEGRKEEKRGRKRKEREEETQEVRPAPALEPESPGKMERERKEKDPEKEKRKTVRTPTRPALSSTSVGSSVTVPPTPATPSLKIRLPRLNNINGLHNPGPSGINASTPTRL
ncbi:hypothetical protein AMATHDRAFT_68300 [Amanita thiersii Skay4041]|uniref:PHD-type domain-containing protein n=1 Tax=Amanita thiersii Skay4041 TaxID=703135 RepID=A0A2A9NFZ3_9AGAR|nr:hypothetical protein AMATHDRAFT_68300 [Amanita thiersii Skay4041]